MKRLGALPIGFATLVAGTLSMAQTPRPPLGAPVASSSVVAPPPSVIASAPPVAEPAPSVDPSRGDHMRAYHAALGARRLGQQDLRLEDVQARVAEAEAFMTTGRTDEAIARLTDLVEHPKFDLFANTEDGRAAVFRLGDALATAGIYEPARAYLRRVLKTNGAWIGSAPYARRSVRRLVDIALESQNFVGGTSDLQDLPTSTPAEVMGDIHYMNGRGKEAAADPDGALAEYAQVPQSARFWAQATYLSGLIQVEKGHFKEGEDLFCKVADPKRSDNTTPVFADENYFAVRDAARLGLGRIAHEQFRNDDARYYYYLVPRDSDRLAEALYEAATTRYEKKDYDGARELLDELKGLGVHNRYEDETWILDSYIDLARCKFEDADRKLVEFLRRYEPVRDAARRVQGDDRAMVQLLSAARSGADAGGTEIAGGTVTPDTMRAIAALVRLDPAYGAVVRRLAVLDREASGLRQALGQLGDMQKTLASNGGVRPAEEKKADPNQQLEDAKAALAGVKRQIAELRASGAKGDQIGPLEQAAHDLDVRIAQGAPTAAAAAAPTSGTGTDLPQLLADDASLASSLMPRIDAARKLLTNAETELAKDALHRVDLRLSRLLRRARLGRIESVLGRKRALEVEIEAINDGILPQGAFDSLDVARYLQDNEEYWPFEGDDWPDEFVGEK
jgi:tetratricopeptide (TPR) repeat protein